jgi:hypothetical protein
MNERIKELAVAAAPANSSIPHSEWNIPKEFIEKFAELIVRECAEIANSGIDPAESHLIGNDILEHFGVEE